jgi:hypothetical protein
MPGALADLSVVSRLALRSLGRRWGSRRGSPPDLDTFRDSLQALLDAAEPGLVAEYAWLELPGSTPPWTGCGVAASVGDAVSYCSVLRHHENDRYCALLADTESDRRVGTALREAWGGDQAFDSGLYAASEMFTEGFLHLYQAGTLKRRVYDHPRLQELLNVGRLAETLGDKVFDILWDAGCLPAHLGAAELSWLKRFGILDEAVAADPEHLELPGHAPLDNDLRLAEVRTRLSHHANGRSLRNGALLHAAFLLGSQWMYDTLNAMPDHERALFRMTTVSRVNQLYRGEDLDRAQRLESRLINSTMKMTLLGAAVSDQLEDGQVVSGVGGQYNFVAMAHALDSARSILMLRSHRGTGTGAVSNIVWEYPHATIPRHLRDLVVTEYGVADLRSASDEEVIRAMICLADNRWQEELRSAAARAGKLDPGWRVPEPWNRNSPAWVEETLAPWRSHGVIRDYPFGSDFTPDEQILARALGWLQSRGRSRFGRLALLGAAAGPRGKPHEIDPGPLRRMELERPSTLRERLDRRLVCLAIRSTTPRPAVAAD